MFRRTCMKKIGLMFLMLAIGVAVGIRISGRLSPVEGQAKPGTGFAAVPGAVGGQDLSGAYDVVKNWAKDVSARPGNEKWTYGAGERVFAESPNRIYALYRGEIPKMAPPKAMLLPQAGPSITFPVAGFWRDATVASLPGLAERIRKRANCSPPGKGRPRIPEIRDPPIGKRET